MKKMKKIVIFIVLLAVYLNIGWAMGTYYHNNIFTKTPDELSSIEHVLAGGWDFFADESADYSDTLLKDQVVCSIGWPVFMVALGASWLVFGIVKLFWLICCGGIAKIIGIG